MWANDFELIDISDITFAKFLSGLDKHWSYTHVNEFTRFSCNGIIAAVVQYKNDHPVARAIWIRKDLKPPTIPIIIDEVELGDICKVNQHSLKVIAINSKNKFGKIVTMCCYEAGCCAEPFIMTMTCSMRDAVELKSIEVREE